MKGSKQIAEEGGRLNLRRGCIGGWEKEIRRGRDRIRKTKKGTFQKST
jgi:hypothetical protein